MELESRLEHWIPCVHIHILASRQWVACLDAIWCYNEYSGWTQRMDTRNTWSHSRTSCLHLFKYWNKGSVGSFVIRSEGPDRSHQDHRHCANWPYVADHQEGQWKFTSFLNVLICFEFLHLILFSSLGCMLFQVLEKGAKSIVLASHLGRPGGRVVARLQLAPTCHLVCQCLSLLIVLIGLAPYITTQHSLKSQDQNTTHWRCGSVVQC